MNIGIIREGKNPPDKRVAFSPKQCREIMEKYPKVRIFVQPSPLRCFKDEEYLAQGCELSEDLSYCDLLFGIKEVPVEMLLPRKTYLFFSHTIKKQPYNRKLLQAILKQKITMVDYETLKNPAGERVVAFGRYAGLVGAYNGILAYGKRFNLFDLRPAHSLFDRKEMQLELQKVKLPPIKIAVTGNGRVTKGAMEMLEAMNIRRVSVDEYLKSTPTEPIYVQLRSADYHQHHQHKTFGNDFYTNPESYESSFDKFYTTTDLLIATAYWNPQAPVLFTKEAMRSADFKIKVIADVTCDINGSIPSTLKASTIAEPLYDYNPKSESIEKPLSSIDYITVMAIDNLPCEMPRDASVDFGQDLIQRVLPNLLGEDTDQLIEKATIAKHGRLTSYFSYLEDYVLQEV